MKTSNGLKLPPRVAPLLVWAACLLLVIPAAQAGGAPDISVRILPSPEIVSPGFEVSYQIVVANNGPGAAGIVDLRASSNNQPTFPFGSTVTQDLSLTGPPGWSCIFLALPPSSHSCGIESMPVGTASFVFRLRTYASSSGPFQVNVGVDTTPADPDPSNNTAVFNGTIVTSVPALSPWCLMILSLLLMGFGIRGLSGR